jgi:putative toxin-antitoxin system antitoxin component (TIGR02293 family)
MAKIKPYTEIDTPLTTVNEDAGVYEAMNILRMGITFSDFLQVVHESLLTMQEWAQILHLDARTLQRYRVSNLTFAPLQSEKILEIKILNKLGAEAFGDAVRFDTWLNAENISLGGARPKDLLDNAFGIALIKDALIRIQYGILA